MAEVCIVTTNLRRTITLINLSSLGTRACVVYFQETYRLQTRDTNINLILRTSSLLIQHTMDPVILCRYIDTYTTKLENTCICIHVII